MQKGNTPLHIAVKVNRPKVVKALIILGTDKYMTNQVGNMGRDWLRGPMVMRVSCLMYASEAVYDCIAFSL